MTDFLLKNIDTSMQNEGVPGIPGCREGKGDLNVLWLDLANAYGSIPHTLVESTLNGHHVPS